MTDAIPATAQDGPSGPQDGPGAPEAATESSGATREPQTGTQRFLRLRDQLAAEKAKLDAAQRRPDLDHLRVTPQNGMAAGLAIALFWIDHHIREIAQQSKEQP